MGKDEMQAGDIVRILLGDAPPAFLLEVLLRTVIVYTCFLIVVRWLGKRMAGQLTFVEMSVMLMLGAIVSPAMQAPDKGILVGIFILFCTLMLQKGVAWLTFNKPRAHRLLQGEPSCLVQDGVLNTHELKNVRITSNQLFAALREKGIYNLGEVERVYMEAYGEFSVYKAGRQKPGLALFPPKGDFSGMVKDPVRQLIACASCGFTDDPILQGQKCPVCHNVSWSVAVVSLNDDEERN